MMGLLIAFRGEVWGQMPRAVSTSEAKSKLTALIGWVREHREAVVVENRGKPRAVILSYEEYEALQALKEQRRRQDLLDQLRRLQARVSARNADLSAEEADALADEVTRAAVDSLVEQGRVRFEP